MIEDRKKIDIYSEILNLTGKDFFEKKIQRVTSVEAFLISSILQRHGFRVDVNDLIPKFNIEDLFANDLYDQSHSLSSQKSFYIDSQKIEDEIDDREILGDGVYFDVVSVSELFPGGLPQNFIANKDFTYKFSDRELRVASLSEYPDYTLAGFFCAKEVVVKAKLTDVTLEKIEFDFDEFGVPYFQKMPIVISHLKKNGLTIAALKSTNQKCLEGIVKKSKKVNIFLYADSSAMRRGGQSPSFEITYPFLLQEKLLKSNISAVILNRAMGGCDFIKGISYAYTDLGYVLADKNTNEDVINVMIFQLGQVDAGNLTPKLPSLKSLDPRVMFSFLKKIINQIFNLLFYYPYLIFNLKRFIKVCGRLDITLISVQLSIMDVVSGVGTGSKSKLNLLIKKLFSNNIDVDELISSAGLNVSDIYFDNGHLTEFGHQFYAEQISKAVIDVCADEVN